MISGLADSRKAITDLLAQAQRWWARRTSGERRLLLLLALFVIGAALYRLLFAPLMEQRDLAMKHYQRQVATLEWLQRNPPADSRPDVPGGDWIPDGQQLLTRITVAAKDQSLLISRIQPEGDGAVVLILEAVPFADFVLWLDAVLRASNIRVRQATLDAADGQGHVNVRIILELLTVAAVADKSDHGAIAVIAGSTP